MKRPPAEGRPAAKEPSRSEASIHADTRLVHGLFKKVGARK